MHDLGVASALPPPPAPAPAAPRRWRLAAALFTLTFASAVVASVWRELDAASVADKLAALRADPSLLLGGLPFAIAVLGILLAHELGHLVAARRHGVDQSLPYFIPAPTLFGTLGAVILMRSQPADRRVLLWVAVAGPFAGLLVAVPVLAWGLAHSMPVTFTELPDQEIVLGNSLLFGWLARAFAPPAELLDLHPLAIAGWVGLFVTSLNLIPAAQLDGGHIAYALLGRRQTRLSNLVLVALLALGVALGLGDGGPLRGAVWIVWAALLFILGVAHPPVRDETVPLTRRHRAVGLLAFLLFVVTFTPVPIERAAVADDPAPTSRRHAPDRPRASSPGEEFRL